MSPLQLSKYTLKQYELFWYVPLLEHTDSSSRLTFMTGTTLRLSACHEMVGQKGETFYYDNLISSLEKAISNHHNVLNEHIPKSFLQ